MRSRPFSAYSNLCSVEELEEIELQLIDWQSHFNEESYEIEVEIQRETSKPGGLAFRIIGSRSSGIFVSYVDGKSQQASQLQEGDLLKECNGKSMSGITCEQAASILRFSLSHNGVLHTRIARKGCGPLLMAKRRSLVQYSGEQEKQHYAASSRVEIDQRSLSRGLRQSTSCPDYRPFCNIPVKVSVMNSILLRNVESVDEEIELLMESEQRTSLDSPDSVTTNPEKGNRCCICSRKIRLKRLHMISHSWLAVLKLLPIRKSSRSAFHSTSYHII